MIDIDTIARIIDKAAFDPSRDRRKPGYNRSPKDTERRRRCALAKAQRILDAIKPSSCHNARDAQLGVKPDVPYNLDHMPENAVPAPFKTEPSSHE